MTNEQEYSETELHCKGCMGPCGRCEALAQSAALEALLKEAEEIAATLIGEGDSIAATVIYDLTSALRQLLSDQSATDKEPIMRAPTTEPHPVADPRDLDDLDPGIRDVVRKLRASGFETTDSGDGVSKPASDRVMNFPHVACSVSAGYLFSEAKRLQDLLGDEWCVEATYLPKERECIMLASRPMLTNDEFPDLSATEEAAFKAGWLADTLPDGTWHFGTDGHNITLFEKVFAAYRQSKAGSFK